MTTYERISHTHCFNQPKPPCGKKAHAQCCLCDLKSSPVAEPEGWEEHLSDYLEGKIEKSELARLLRSYFIRVKKETLSRHNQALVEKFREIVGPVDEEFLAQPDAEDYVGEWSVNVDRKRILSALDKVIEVIQPKN